MIVKMNKVSLVLLDKYRDESLKQLRRLGVLHLDALKGNGEKFEHLSSLRDKLSSALVYVPAVSGIEQQAFKGIIDSLEKADAILEKVAEKQAASERILAIVREVEKIGPLGDFDPSLLKTLEEKNLRVTVFKAKKTDEALFTGENMFRVAVTKNNQFFAVVGNVPENLKPVETIDFPEKSLTELNKEKAALGAVINKLNKELEEMSSMKMSVSEGLKIINQDLVYENVRSGINKEEDLSYLSGFCPAENLDKLKAKAAEEGWGLLIEEPTEEDEVPTELKVGKFTSMLSPVLDFLGILPGYREYDISFFFLCFFSIFTAMLIGDAGYGLIFLAVTAIVMIAFGSKKKPIPKAVFLLLLLSVTTIAWGIVTGTWFASQSIMEIGPIAALKLDVFKGSDEEQIAVVMGISFFLGIVQLLIGVVQNFKKNFPKKNSFAQIGWFAVLIAVYYLVLVLVVRRAGLDTYPKQMIYLLLGGVAVIFLFGGQEEGQSFIKGIINSLTNFLQLFLDVVGTFSDIMSYVRLFAVGLASVKIAETFNQLGAGMSGSWMIVFGILIIIIGHTLNIVLGLMAILVHAVRLNILEYSGKVGVEWSGFKYDPFKVSVDESQSYKGEFI